MENQSEFKAKKRACRLIGVIFVLAASMTHGAVVQSGQIGHPDGSVNVHNPAKGRWDDSPRIALEFLGMLGEGNDDNYLFNDPSGITSDPGGNLYVLDSGNFRVQVFDRDRKYVRSFGRQGQGPGDFGRTDCIDVDGSGNVYVGDPGNGRIGVFEPSGKQLKVIRVSATNIVFGVMKNGDILLRNPSLDGGRGLKEGHVPLFKVLDGNGNIKREYGQGKYFAKSPYSTGGNRSLLAKDADDNACLAFLFQNRITKYSPDGKLVYSADRPLPKDKLSNKEMGTYTTINSGLDVDPRGRAWVVTYTRKWKQGELVHYGLLNGKKVLVSGDRTETKTDLFEIQIFDGSGVFLQRIPLDHFCDYLKIIGDKAFILDRDRLAQFYVYRIRETPPTGG